MSKKRYSDFLPYTADGFLIKPGDVLYCNAHANREPHKVTIYNYSVNQYRCEWVTTTKDQQMTEHVSFLYKHKKNIPVAVDTDKCQ